jgi:D-alanine-D-alanine ligase
MIDADVKHGLRVDVLCGGDSSEREGSLQSGETMYQSLKRSGFANTRLRDITYNNLATLCEDRPDVAFLAFHGGYGEDGKIQALLELFDIAYTGSGVAASAISMDKHLFSRFVSSLGYKVADQVVIEGLGSPDISRIRYPAVIKPATQGCSYGVFYVESLEELRDHFPFASRFSDRIIVEEYIEGREFTVGIFDDPDLGQARVAPIEETIIHGGKKIQDYEVKYNEEERYIVCQLPAKLSLEEESKIGSICLDIYQRLGCSGFSRMDVRLTPLGEVYVLENNTCPGMLNMVESDFPKMLKAMDIPLESFVEKMVEQAMQLHTKRKSQVLPSIDEMVRYMGLDGGNS